VSDWESFNVATGGAAAALTGLLFIAVSLRPREIRQSSLMVGRARSSFYAFAAVTYVALMALAGTASRWIGAAQLAVAIGTVILSTPFTREAHRSGRINYRRAFVYHLGLLVVATAGLVRAAGGDPRDYSAILAAGELLLLGIALSNAWRLVITHDPPDPAP
jgi:modulator of FtsH protease